MHRIPQRFPGLNGGEPEFIEVVEFRHGRQVYP
jgi:hypothetical protein